MEAVLVRGRSVKLSDGPQRHCGPKLGGSAAGSPWWVRERRFVDGLVNRPWRVVISGALSFQVKLVSVYAGELAQRCSLSMVAADKEVSLELFLRS
ncbi:hypothetical protein F2Q68_00011546 [Brassica cretica]|uniref:Uncharacterized protein n=1 Tax=Brassica cretica TaxID=69181 RepID=A0A8S9KWP7_BRACR|nr:hypothetical protein F2Q68_00011546 [Brassica cretica]